VCATETRRRALRAIAVRVLGRGRLRLGFFFFSSRRRHTRWPRDWSSDVCSSDLLDPHGLELGLVLAVHVGLPLVDHVERLGALRSEERRVGKEWGSAWGPERGRNNGQTRRRRRLRMAVPDCRSRERGTATPAWLP